MSKIEYLAGLTDGEGNLGIYKNKKDYQLRFRMASTNKEVIIWLKENFGGAYYEFTKSTTKHAQSWIWMLLSHKDVYKLCKEILLFLIIKREVCELCIEAYEDTFHWDYHSRALPEYAKNKREEYYQRTLELNKNGPKEESKTPELKLKKRTITLEEYE